MNYESHSFSVEEAKKHGIEKAILLQNIRFWLKKNKANGREPINGRYWTYNSAKAFAELFPYMKEKSIHRWLIELEKDGYIITGNFNNSQFDRTKWYSINEPEFEVPQNQTSSSENQTSISEKQTSISHFATPIPYIEPYIEPDINTPKSPKIESKNEHLPFALRHGNVLFKFPKEEQLSVVEKALQGIKDFYMHEIVALFSNKFLIEMNGEPVKSIKNLPPQIQHLYSEAKQYVSDYNLQL